jgi:colicin import membrane protein
MSAQPEKKFLIASCVFHAVVLLALILSYSATSPMFVIENTNQHDVISAVVLGDTAKSKILPHEEPVAKPIQKPEPEPVKKEVAPPPKPVAKVEPKKAPPPKTIEKDVIALKAAEKKIADKKAEDLKKKQQEAFAKDLLADIKKHSEKKVKVKQADLQSKFAKMLKEQSEQSLRENLMNENIKMSGKLSRQSQGIVNKYKALIIQAISEHWQVPLQANRSLYSELMIRLSPEGAVLDVKITKSSGDPALDSSARSAVLKASPLPVPGSRDEFEPFKQFVLKVRPENIVDL